MAKYAYAIDECTNEGYDYADLYTPDGVFRTSRGGKVEAQGYYQDEYVRTPQGWRFKSRTHVLAAGQQEVSRGSQQKPASGQR